MQSKEAWFSSITRAGSPKLMNCKRQRVGVSIPPPILSLTVQDEISQREINVGKHQQSGLISRPLQPGGNACVHMALISRGNACELNENANPHHSLLQEQYLGNGNILPAPMWILAVESYLRCWDESDMQFTNRFGHR